MSQPDLRALAQRGAIHFVGICGAGMSALAEMALHFGARVTGCDVRPTECAERLKQLGAEIWQGHDPSHVDGVSAVVVTSAVAPDAPELAAAREQKIPVIKRAQALGSIVNKGTVIAVAGTHGKTTTTAMTATILSEAGMNPTAFVGGHVSSWQGGLRLGSDELYVVEADEYDRSFLTLRPTAAVVTTLEADHLDIYGTLEGVQEAFDAFLALLPDDGCAIICADDAGARRLARKPRTPVTWYGIEDRRAQLRATNLENRGRGSRFTITNHGEPLGDVTLTIPGMHNVRNALAAWGAAQFVGAPFEAAQRAFATFGGVGRRFEEIGRARKIVIVDDYAHHPTEIRATIAAARSAYEGHRIVAVFQPHLYSRTRDFAGDFAIALMGADEAWVTGIYPAREAPIQGVTGELIVNAASGKLHYVEQIERVKEELMAQLRPGDVCVFMGAGNIDTVAYDVLSALRGDA